MINIPLRGMFKQKYGKRLKGRRDWVNAIHEDDRKVLARRAFACSGYGVLGGLARAESAERDSRGRFK